MPIDIASLLLAMTVAMLTIAVALPAVMGEVDAPARRAQIGVMLQAAGWALLLLSGTVAAGSWADRTLSTLAMAGIAAGLAFNGRKCCRSATRSASRTTPFASAGPTAC